MGEGLSAGRRTGARTGARSFVRSLFRHLKKRTQEAWLTRGPGWRWRRGRGGGRALGLPAPPRGEGTGHRLTDSRTRSRAHGSRINNFIYTLHTVCTAQPRPGRRSLSGWSSARRCPAEPAGARGDGPRRAGKGRGRGRGRGSPPPAPGGGNGAPGGAGRAGGLEAGGGADVLQWVEVGRPERGRRGGREPQLGPGLCGLGI